MTNTYYYARFAENEFELGRFETKAARDAWVNYQDEFSVDMGTTADNAPFERVAITREQAEQIAGDLIDISEYYENENGVEWLVMIPMF